MPDPIRMHPAFAARRATRLLATAQLAVLVSHIFDLHGHRLEAVVWTWIACRSFGMAFDVATGGRS